MTTRARRTFVQDFKLEAAQLVQDQGYSIRAADTAMNVGTTTMERWVRQLKNERHGIADHPTALTPEHRKIKELEKRIKQVEMEKEILKKATALLMSDSMNTSH